MKQIRIYGNLALVACFMGALSACSLPSSTTSSFDLGNTNNQTTAASTGVTSSWETVPTVTLTATDATSGTTVTVSTGQVQNLTVNVGDTVNYSWSSNGATSLMSSYTTNIQDTCGDQFPGANAWSASDLTGSSSGVISACQSGIMYTVVLTAAGDAVSGVATLTLSVGGTTASGPSGADLSVAYDPTLSNCSGFTPDATYSYEIESCVGYCTNAGETQVMLSSAAGSAPDQVNLAPGNYMLIMDMVTDTTAGVVSLEQALPFTVSAGSYTPVSGLFMCFVETTRPEPIIAPAPPRRGGNPIADPN